MDLSVASRRHKGDSVTLLSYANASTGTKTVSNNNNNSYVHRFASHCVTQTGSNCYSVAQPPPCVVKKSEKFLRTFRRRSKSATRLTRETDSSESPNRGIHPEDRVRSFGGSALTLNDESGFEPEPSPKNSITYVANGERARNPDKCVKPERVTLVGFATKSTCNLLNLTGDSSFDGDSPKQTGNGKSSGAGFSTLKTSREVKMERERLRQERLQKLTQDTKEWFDRVRQESKDTSLLSNHQKLFNATAAQLAEERARFFDEAREKFHSKMSGSSGNEEFFGQFVRENQERFSQLLQQNQNAAFPRCQLPSTAVKRAPVEATDNKESICSSGSSSISSNSSATAATTIAASTSSNNVSSLSSTSVSAKPQYRHRALSRDGARDIFEPIRESNQAPSAAEVVASLLSERGYGTRIPLKQRLVANNIVSRANNLNNNRAVLKKDLIENNAARIHTIKIQRETTSSGEGSNPSSLSNCGDQTNETEQEDDCEDEDDLEKQKKDSDEEFLRHPSQRIEKLQRTNSGSSGLSTSSSSGFSSLGGDKHLRANNESPVQSKFRQLLERKNSCEHHPSFNNHFVGFGKFGAGGGNANDVLDSKLIAFPSFGNFPTFSHRPLLVQLSDGPQCRVPPPTPTLQPKAELESTVKKIGAKMNLNGKVTKAKSTTIVVTSGKDGTTYR